MQIIPSSIRQELEFYNISMAILCHLNCLLIDFHPVRLLIRFRLWDCPGAASPGVEHHRMLLDNVVMQ